MSALEAALAAQARPSRRHAMALAAAGLAAPWLAGCAGPGPAASAAIPTSTPAPPAARPGPAQEAPPPHTASAPSGADAPPPIGREFRAAWVATVAHIDWPSRRGLTTAQQRAEMLDLLDKSRGIGLNAIVLQVRPAADAIYPSALEPWSEYLTGASGRAPDTPWDPLAEWVDQAHRRGLELHAWFNPYRARHASATTPPAAHHIATTDPGVVKRYGDLLWMDPAEPGAARRMVDVVLDVVQRYDIDGVHIDDYFYPYPVKDGQGQDIPFPDEPSWQRAGAPPDRAAWRRAQVDGLIERLYAAIHKAKPWVRFGISPFGLPRPDRRPPGITGFSQYDQLHADVERWLSEGWLDYLAPQLYWPIAQTAQAFPVLLDAWLGDNPRGRHIWAGLYTSRIGNHQRPYTPQEVLAQIGILRERSTANPLAAGHLHFSMAALAANREGVADRLREGPYAQPALPPATPWLAEPPPARPQVTITAASPGQGVRLAWQATPHTPPWRHALLHVRSAGRWDTLQWPVPGAGTHLLGESADRAVLQGVGRTGLVGEPAVVQETGGRWRLLGSESPRG
ncbi:MAG: glycoside hydrolase family 10 protein [Rubrivivax sp.]